MNPFDVRTNSNNVPNPFSSMQSTPNMPAQDVMDVQSVIPPANPRPNTFFENWAMQQQNRNMGPMSYPSGGYSGPFSTPPQQAPFIGKFISDINEIVMRDIPTDGRIGVFPMKDLSGIIVRGWNANGNLVTARYILDPTQFPAPSETAPTDMSNILDRISRIEERLDATTTKSTASSRKPKGEVTTNE